MTTLNEELTAQDVLDAWQAWEEVWDDPYMSELRAAIKHLERAQEHLDRELLKLDRKSQTPVGK
jgi:hypothetical protein